MSDQLEPIEATPQHPIHLVVTDDLVRNRLTVFFRLLLAIPLVLWLALWGIATVFAAIIAWVAGLVTGRIPNSLHSFMAQYVRFSTQVNAYLWIAADPYPSFMGDAGYPVDLEVADPVEQSRVTILFRLVLAIPAAIVTNVLQNVAWIVALLGWFLGVFTGRMNKGMEELLAYILRYQAQTYGYVLLLTQRYPSFSDD
jgi:ABC-type amino acid transport system permease subunit